ncbi:MAG TPA: PKD domain-containing protein [Candidatus Limnocylindria bacterium]|nr:PKD domain-containing protein [Candidatus Limnocylindria bacterium]
MVEFAIVAPLLALFIVIAVDFGRAYFSHIQIMNGAREAAALGGGQLSGPTDTAMMRDRVLLEANVQDHAAENDSITIDVVCETPAGATIDCGDAAEGSGVGNTVTVTVTRDFSLITPLADAILGGNFKMRASATAPVLGLVASGGGGGGGGGCSLPTASFSVTVLSGLLVETDPSASTPQSPGDPCNISGYHWTWQAGGTEELGQATARQHTYPNPGTYTITLRVTNQAGQATTTRQVTVPTGGPVVCDPPDARYAVSENGKTHTYTDTSTVANSTDCPITAWLWSFPDGTQSNAPNPTKTYQNNASHSVTLQVTNAGGSDTFTGSH